MRRIFPFSTRFFRTARVFAVGFGVFGLVCSARADEFSLVAPGSPTYAQLSQLARPGTPPIQAPITRYEAALQTARAILDIQNRNSPLISRSDWRALKFLTLSFGPELRQLGVDVEAARALAEIGLKSSEVPFKTRASQPDFASDRLNLGASGSASNKRSATTNSGFLMFSPGADKSAPQNRALEIPLSQRLRSGAAIIAVDRNQNTPFGESDRLENRASGIANPKNSAKIASQKSLAFDVNPTLTVRAVTSQRNLTLAPEDSPFLRAPLFAGASDVKSAGGGLDLNLGAGLKLSTELEKLRANTGAGASRIGGATSVSLFQNRLSMNMSLSRLLPEDKNALPSTAAQMGASLDVSRRLSLNLQYQGLFSPTQNDNASKVSGGVSLSF